MGMQTLMPDGEVLTEFFKDEKSMKKRRKQLEQIGGKVQRVIRLHVYEGRSKYQPHQGEREKQRRLRQLAASA